MYCDGGNQNPLSADRITVTYTINWTKESPVTQDPTTSLYVPDGGAEVYTYDSGSKTFLPERQRHATLVRTGPSTYERQLPYGSKQLFGLSDGSTSYPRRIFMTQMVDARGNSVNIGYDSSLRVTTLTDAVGQVTTLSYELANDPLKITKVIGVFESAESTERVRVDLLEARQTTGSNNDLLRKYTYNSQHETLTETDAAGQVTAFGFNPVRQLLTRTNAKNETITYGYGDGGTVPFGNLACITSPVFNGTSL
jgi:YD repeat-containing protein